MRAAAGVARPDEGVSVTIAEIADQDLTAELTEPSRSLRDAPRRIELTVLCESREHVTGEIERCEPRGRTGGYPTGRATRLVTFFCRRGDRSAVIISSSTTESSQ